jgi:flagellar protein FliJ
METVGVHDLVLPGIKKQGEDREQMKKFNFRLQKLLMLKEYAEMEAKLNFAKEMQKKNILETENREMRKSILESILNSYMSLKEGSTIEYNDVELQEKYLSSLTAKISFNEIKKKEIELNLIGLREKLITASRDKKVMDKLKENAQKDYRKEYNKDQIKKLDEKAGQSAAKRISSYEHEYLTEKTNA